MKETNGKKFATEITEVTERKTEKRGNTLGLRPRGTGGTEKG